MKLQQMHISEYAFVKKLWSECELSEEPEDQKEEIEALIKSSQGSGFVVKENGIIVGAVLCGNDGRYGYIHHLAVAEGNRKKGIGKALVEACCKFLKKRHVLIMVRNNNEIGNKFWSHLKFQNADWIKVMFVKAED